MNNEHATSPLLGPCLLSPWVKCVLSLPRKTSHLCVLCISLQPCTSAAICSDTEPCHAHTSLARAAEQQLMWRPYPSGVGDVFNMSVCLFVSSLWNADVSPYHIVFVSSRNYEINRILLHLFFGIFGNFGEDPDECWNSLHFHITLLWTLLARENCKEQL